MGMFALVETYCFSCKQKATSATKLPDDLFMQTITPGDVFCSFSEPFASCVLRLKEACACGKDIAIELQNGMYVRPEPYERATWAEGPWASVDPILE